MSEHSNHGHSDEHKQEADARRKQEQDDKLAADGAAARRKQEQDDKLA